MSSTCLLLPSAEGLLYVKGSLNVKDAKYWEPYWFVVRDGLLLYYHLHLDTVKKKKDSKESEKDLNIFEQDKLIDLIPLTYVQFGDVHKKDKILTNYAFVIQVIHKKWRCVFCTDNDKELELWLKVFADNINLAQPSLSNTTITDACLKANKFLPSIIEITINHTDKNLRVEGLYRVPGDQAVITEVLEKFDKGIYPDFDTVKVDPHMVCGVLKLYLRQLSDPLIPASLYKQFVNATSIEEIRNLVRQLPSPNLSTLCFLLQFLGRVQSECSHNLMDVNNLATVFGPGVLRSNENIKSLNLEETAQANQVIKVLIDHRSVMFSEEEMKLYSQPVFDVNAEMSRTRIHMTALERSMIQTVLLTHNFQSKTDSSKDTFWENYLIFLINIKNPKSQELEPRILISNQYRIYFFLRGGKLEYDFHFLELQDIESPSKFQATLKWENSSIDTTNGKKIHSGKPLSVTILPVSYASFDIDSIIGWILKNYERNFVGTPENCRFTYNINPPSRKEQILSSVVCEDKDLGCSGLIQTYTAVCDWRGIPISQAIVWDLENYFYPNNLRSMNLSELITKDKWPGPEFESLIYSLHFNLWFKSLNCKNCTLGNDATLMIAEMMKCNSTLEELSLEDAAASRIGIIALCEAFNSNTKLAIRQLNIAGNNLMDPRALANFSTCLSSSLTQLSQLNVANAKILKLTPIFEALGRSNSFLISLVKLDVSLNKFDISSSKLLGMFIKNTYALQYLNISGTNPSWLHAFEQLDKIENRTITHLDISHNITKLKFQIDLIQFLQRISQVQVLNAANMGLIAETGYKLVENSKTILSLDLSENDINDDGVLLLMNAITKRIITTNLSKLMLNKLFVKRSKQRTAAITAMAKAINTIGLKELSLSHCRLKRDLTALIIKLLDNTSLEVLDITGNLSGDSLAIALTKFLQNNRTLHTLFWDENEISVNGLRSISIGLQRNSSIRHFPLPFIDITAFVKKENVETEVVNRIIRDLQRLVHEKTLNFMTKNELYEDSESVAKSASDISSKTTFLPILPKTPTEKTSNAAKSPTKKKPKTFINVDIHRASQIWGDPEDYSSEEGSGSNAENHESKNNTPHLPLNGEYPSEPPYSPRDEEDSDEKRNIGEDLSERDHLFRRDIFKDKDQDQDDSEDREPPLSPSSAESTFKVRKSTNKHSNIGKRKRKKTQRGRTPLGPVATAIGLQRQNKSSIQLRAEARSESIIGQNSTETLSEYEESLHPIAELNISATTTHNNNTATVITSPRIKETAAESDDASSPPENQ